MASRDGTAYGAISYSASPSAADTPLAAGCKQQAHDLGDGDEDEAPPVYPDYSIAKSNKDSIASGDDSGQWEVEEECILAAHAKQ